PGWGDGPAHAPHPVIVREVAVSCECGDVTHQPCEWRGPTADTVVVEYMPEYLRASHAVAGNAGVYPANGAVRIRCERSCAEAIVEVEDGWAEIVVNNAEVEI